MIESMRMPYRRLALLACGALFAVLAGGCATAPANSAHVAALDEVQAGHAVVFGRLEWFENGRRAPIRGNVFAPRLVPRLLRLGDRARITGGVEEGGWFAWSLEPGVYLVDRMSYRHLWDGNFATAPQVAFWVPDADGPYYLGRLRGDFAPEAGIEVIGDEVGPVRFRVRDEYEGDLAAFRNRFEVPGAGGARSLMVRDERLPEGVDTAAEFETAQRVVDELFPAGTQ